MTKARRPSLRREALRHPAGRVAIDEALHRGPLSTDTTRGCTVHPRFTSSTPVDSAGTNKSQRGHPPLRDMRSMAGGDEPMMGDLPRSSCMTPSRPFQHTRDYAGPIFIKISKGRDHRNAKAFIVMFVCMSTKAVHLDVASDTVEAFLATLCRFTARRGLCEVIYSNCDINFVGADRELRALFTGSSKEGRHIANELMRDRVAWRFNPPAAPHFGGL